jgi:hypothetical protein
MLSENASALAISIRTTAWFLARPLVDPTWAIKACPSTACPQRISVMERGDVNNWPEGGSQNELQAETLKSGTRNQMGLKQKQEPGMSSA